MMAPDSEDPKLPAHDRDELRAFLQRGEVRLSTMHRIAGVFLNGAGLLFLIPILVKDAFIQMMLSVTYALTSLNVWQMIAGVGLAAAAMICLWLPGLSLYYL